LVISTSFGIALKNRGFARLQQGSAAGGTPARSVATRRSTRAHRGVAGGLLCAARLASRLARFSQRVVHLLLDTPHVARQVADRTLERAETSREIRVARERARRLPQAESRFETRDLGFETAS
jgi:hypothetical protein